MGCAQTGDLVVLEGELVVVCDLLVHLDLPTRVDHDARCAVNAHYACATIRLFGGVGGFVGWGWVGFLDGGGWCE